MDATVPAAAMILLDFVYRTDAGSPPPKCYETIFGNRQSALAKPLISMTLGEVIDAQKTWASKTWALKFKSGVASSAAGAAQFMRATLIDLSKTLNLSGDLIFDATLQDRLAYQLLLRRGYADFIADRLGVTEFGNRLSMEWASLPVLSPCKGAHRNVVRGETFYAGDGVNMVLTSPVEVERVLAQVLAAANKRSAAPADAPKPVAEPKPAPSPAPAPVKPGGGKTVFAAVGAAFLIAFGSLLAWAEGSFSHLISIIERIF